MTFLRQQLPALLMPFDISLMLLLVGLILRRRALIWAGVVILWVGSTPFVSHVLVRTVEGWDSERASAADAPLADAIVVLSTGRPIAPGRAVVSEWNDADRFFGGVELFLAGKAPLLVFTGAWTPGVPNPPLEGDVLTGYANALGVPLDHIATTGRVTNTAEEAREVAAFLRKKQPPPVRVLLVTSASHMARAQRLFERAGLAVSPFRVDFRISAGSSFGPLALVPSAGALGLTQEMMREAYGRMFYRVMGS